MRAVLDAGPDGRADWSSSLEAHRSRPIRTDTEAISRLARVKDPASRALEELDPTTLPVPDVALEAVALSVEQHNALSKSVRTMHSRGPLDAPFVTRAAAIGLMAAAGCVGVGVGVGPRALHPVHAQFNESVARTLDEQLLLDFVRLRHRENPYFLQVGSITSQLSLAASCALTGDIALGGATDTTFVRPNLGLSG